LKESAGTTGPVEMPYLGISKAFPFAYFP